MSRGLALTFAIPYFDNPGYLAEAVESVRAQSVSDWELVVIDDAGPDPAADLVASLRDPRIRYLRNAERLGLPGNWNACVSSSTGTLVTVLHADDRLRPSYAAEILAAAERYPQAAAYFTGAAVIDAQGRSSRTLVDSLKSLMARDLRSGEVSGETGLTALLTGNFVFCPSLALRRSVVGDAPFDARFRFVADWDFTVRQLLAGRSLVGVDQPLLEYRRHEQQTTARMTRDAARFVEELQFQATMAETVAAAGYPRAARAARRRLSTRSHVALSACLDLAHGLPGSARTKAALVVRDMRQGGAPRGHGFSARRQNSL